MTVRDLMDLLQFYPVNAEVFVETRDGKLAEFDEINEADVEIRKPALILTVKDILQAVKKTN